MSKGCHNGVYVDMGLLREHISKLQEEKKLASRLYENVVGMKTVADPVGASQYDSVLRDIEQMVEYFRAMTEKMTDIADEAVQLSHELRGIIADSTNLSERVTAANFAL